MSKPKGLAKITENEIEKQFSRQLSTKNPIDACREALAAIAATDHTFGPLVARIKDFYEAQLDQLQAKRLFEANQCLKMKAASLDERIEKELAQHKQLKRKIQKFSRENEDLANDIEDRENKYTDMQDQLLRISAIDLGGLSMTEESWKLLISQNKDFAEACKELQAKNKAYRRNEKKMINIVLALKKQGVPVEAIYETDVKQALRKKRRKGKYSGTVNSEPPPDDTDAENIVEGSPKMANRPGCVPSLQLEENYYESSESSSYPNDSEDYSSVSVAPGCKTN